MEIIIVMTVVPRKMMANHATLLEKSATTVTATVAANLAANGIGLLAKTEALVETVPIGEDDTTSGESTRIVVVVGEVAMVVAAVATIWDEETPNVGIETATEMTEADTITEEEDEII